MSRWLSSLNQVSSLLEKLDDRVENVVEERAIAIEDGDIATDHEVIIEDILSKRGLVADPKEEVEVDVDADADANESATPEQSHETDDTVDTQDSEHLHADPVLVVPDNNDGDDKKIDSTVSEATEQIDTPPDDNNTKTLQDQKNPHLVEEGQEDAPPITVNTRSEPLDDCVVDEITQPTTQDTNLPPKPLGSVPTNSTQSKKEIELILASKEAQKEVRVLRRHVVKLNSTLEQAESEISALRDELARAAERMEKDRTRAKELKEAAQKRYTEELMANRKQHEQAIKDQQTRFDELLETYKSKLSELENRRKQEGGDWNKEITLAFEREQQMSNQVAMLEYVPKQKKESSCV